MRRVDEYGENCYYRDTRITVFTWLRNNSEYDTDFKDELTGTTLITSTSFNLFYGTPHEKNVRCCENWFSRTCSHITLDCSNIGPLPYCQYMSTSLNVFSHFRLCISLTPPLFLALSHTCGDVVILAILLLTMAMVVFTLKKLKIKNSMWYTLWVFYVITLYMGVFVILTS